MKATIIVAVILAFLLKPQDSQAIANTSKILVISPSGQTSELSHEDLRKQSKKISIVEPNFPGDGIREFLAIDFVNILPKGVTPKTPVTLVGIDQYIFRSNVADLTQRGAALAISSEGAPILKGRGGPFKIIYRTPSPREQYIWYVRAIVFGDYTTSLTIREADSTLRTYKTITADSKKITLVNAPVPSGPRLTDTTSSASSDSKMSSVSLLELMSGHQRQGKLTAIVEDILGNTFHLEGSDLQHTRIGYAKNGKSITLTDGGAFIAITTRTETAKPTIRVPIFFVKNITFNYESKP